MDTPSLCGRGDTTDILLIEQERKCVLDHCERP